MTDFPPLLAGIPDTADADAGDDCGCCAGVEVTTPWLTENRPGLAAVGYAPGRYPDFLASQLARLSSEEYPALARLRSREPDDFSIALLDSWSVTLDVLAFYQERIANEAFLGTATERRSLVELGRLIGYRLRPGVAAAADLVFLMDRPPGAAPTVAEVAVEVGSRVQSVPGPGEDPVTFETTAPLVARVAWNALPARRTRARLPANGDTGCWLQGVSTSLRPGDALVIVGRERLEDHLGSEQWDFRKLTRVEPDAGADRTWVAFTHPLGSIDPPGPVAAAGHRVFALRARGSLFGWNAPHPNLLPPRARVAYGLPSTPDGADWSFDIDTSQRRIVLDGVQEGFVAGGLVVLTRPAAVVELYRIEAAVDDGMSAYAVSGRATRLTLDTAEHLSWFEADYRRVSVYGRSEELAFAETPIAEAVLGDAVELGERPQAMEEGHRIVVRGRRAQAVALSDLVLAADAGPDVLDLPRGTRVTLVGPPLPVAPGDPEHAWRLRAPGGFSGGLVAPLSAFAVVAADETAEIVAEAATVTEAGLADETHALLAFAAPLAHAYDRATTVVHGNVAPATHGETAEEILGDGSAARPHQSFALRGAPLTHVSADTDTGTRSSLEIRVGDVLWHEVPTLHGRGPRERVFETRTEDDGATVVQFGDGVAGARLPSGRNNVVAGYRKGLGRAGSVAAGALSTPLDRPLGLREVFNPLAAAGGDDPEAIDGARRNAPVTTLTLGRVVSLLNYEDFARGFAGVSMAKADFAWDGESRRILLTVAGPGGAPVDAGGAVYQSLLKALRRFGDPFVRLSVASYRPATFRLAMKVLVHPDHAAASVLAELEAALRAAYAIEARGFAPLVSASEIFAVAHAVAGVEAVDLDVFHRTTPPNAAPVLHARLPAEAAKLSPAGTLLAAEILSLDLAPLALTVTT